jgi:predicted transcriptional regulator of viral defense system
MPIHWPLRPERSARVSKTVVEIECESEAIRQLARRVQADYAEMPGLSVTMPQAQRLLNIDRQTCAFVLKTLVSRGFLRRTAQGRYIRV